MLTRHLAHEVGPKGVRVNCIAPSSILTERTEKLSDASSWLTGITIDLAGGRVTS